MPVEDNSHLARSYSTAKHDNRKSVLVNEDVFIGARCNHHSDINPPEEIKALADFQILKPKSFTYLFCSLIVLHFCCSLLTVISLISFFSSVFLPLASLSHSTHCLLGGWPKSRITTRITMATVYLLCSTFQSVYEKRDRTECATRNSAYIKSGVQIDRFALYNAVSLPNTMQFILSLLILSLNHKEYLNGSQAALRRHSCPGTHKHFHRGVPIFAQWVDIWKLRRTVISTVIGCNLESVTVILTVTVKGSHGHTAIFLNWAILFSMYTSQVLKVYITDCRNPMVPTRRQLIFELDLTLLNK